MTHSFFVGMGGLVLETNEGEEYIPGSPRLTLTAQGMVAVQEADLALPDVSLESIKDRSKADGIAKCLACLQAGYMIIQIMDRVISRLPVTLLEINTLGHVLCALIMYTFWFRKPLDLQDPIVLRNEWSKGFTARWSMTLPLFPSALSSGHHWLFWLFWSRVPIFSDMVRPRVINREELSVFNSIAVDEGSGLSRAKPKTSLNSDGNLELHKNPLSTEPISESEAINSMESNKASQRAGERPLTRQIEIHDFPESMNIVRSSLQYGQVTLVWCELDETVDNKQLQDRLLPNDLWAKVTRVYRIRDRQFPKATWLTKHGDITFTPSFLKKSKCAAVCLNSSDILRWELAYSAMKTIRETKTQTRKARLSLRMLNWPEPDNGPIESSGSEEAFSISAIALATACYGGLHLAMWNSHFPSSSEQILWRVSALMIAGSGFLIAILTTYRGFDPDHALISAAADSLTQMMRWLLGNWLWNLFESFLMIELIGSTLFNILFGSVLCALIALAALLFVIYCAARSFIVIEAFISLRSLPVLAYQTPSWTQWIPHL